ncbi:TDP-N-acetylfucosamine:lipid II N-acetylfucosaminyltransferase, partial [Erwinia amylovora]|nr:TDP-N-acetylfucosamine:lipid II N-acetylfucosaminyltransferase [Erwinia amylovora]
MTSEHPAGPLTILLGNSVDASNRHIQALQQIQRQCGSEIKEVLPLGNPLNNESYIQRDRAVADDLFA